MTDKFGVSWIIKDGDFTTNVNGGFLNTNDYEKMNPDSTRFPGYQNILFSLTNRLTTLKGDNVFFPEYGSNLPILLSQPNSPNLSNRVRAEVKDCLSQDDRVKSVDSVIVERQGNKLMVKANITLIGGNESSQFIFPSFYLE